MQVFHSYLEAKFGRRSKHAFSYTPDECPEEANRPTQLIGYGDREWSTLSHSTPYAFKGRNFDSWMQPNCSAV